MAGDVSTSINIVQLAIEIGSIVFFAGGLYVMVKAHSRKIDNLEKKMEEVRENWVDRRMLKTDLAEMEERISRSMEAQANVIVGKVLIAIGSERRFDSRD